MDALVIEYPILGTEPLPVELANTLYVESDGVADFLATADMVTGWFGAVGELHEIELRSIDASAAVPSRELRDCVREVLLACASGESPGRIAVLTLNRFASAAPQSLRLEWEGDAGPRAWWSDTSSGVTATLGRIAVNAIELATGPFASDLRLCQGPGCSMLFLKHHPRRQFCHAGCGHRARQARYYRRHRDAAR